MFWWQEYPQSDPLTGTQHTNFRQYRSKAMIFITSPPYLSQKAVLGPCETAIVFFVPGFLGWPHIYIYIYIYMLLYMAI